jgi:hypothetical protein
MVKKAKLKEDYAPDTSAATSELAVIREHEIKPSDILLGYSRFSERNIGMTAFRVRLLANSNLPGSQREK